MPSGRALSQGPRTQVSSRRAWAGRLPCRDLVRRFCAPNIFGSQSCFPSLSSLHLKGNTVHDPQDESGKAVIVSGGAAHDLPYRRLVVALQASSQRVHEQLLCHAFCESIPICIEDGFKSIRAFESSTIRQRARCVNWELAVLNPPGADRVVVLQSKTHWIHSGVAGGARR